MTSSATPLPEIRLEGLTKLFGEVRAVDDVSLSIQPGEFFSLLGPSGCGKTTTLRMIGGFDLPTAGRVELRGRDVTADPPDRRPVNMVFQQYALFPHLDVGGNVAFGLRRHGVERAEIARRVAEALDLVRLPGYEKRRPNQLSGGQQQRVALARALVNRPTVLLLDEPLGALDLKLRRQLQVELKRIQQEVGITFIYVTHDQEEAMTMSDRIAVMNRGQFEQLGDPESLYERPSTRFVAGFLGVSNLLTGRVEETSGSYATVRLPDDTRVRVPRALADGASDVEVGVRPEKIRMAASTDLPNGENAIVGTVRDASYLGVSTQYVVEAGGGQRLMVYEQNVERTVHGSLHRPGEQVRLTWSPDHTFVIAARREPAAAASA